MADPSPPSSGCSLLQVGAPGAPGASVCDITPPLSMDQPLGTVGRGAAQARPGECFSVMQEVSALGAPGTSVCDVSPPLSTGHPATGGRGAAQSRPLSRDTGETHSPATVRPPTVTKSPPVFLKLTPVTPKSSVTSKSPDVIAKSRLNIPGGPSVIISSSSMTITLPTSAGTKSTSVAESPLTITSSPVTLPPPKTAEATPDTTILSTALSDPTNVSPPSCNVPPTCTVSTPDTSLPSASTTPQTPSTVGEIPVVKPPPGVKRSPKNETPKPITNNSPPVTTKPISLSPPVTTKSKSVCESPVTAPEQCGGPVTSCFVCGEESPTEIDLVNHLTSHWGVCLPLFCSVCDASYFHKDGLETHWYLAHGASRVTYKFLPSTPLRLELDLLGKYSCKYCNVCLGSSPEFRKHVLESHLAPLDCTRPRCSFSTESKRALECHVKVVHSEPDPQRAPRRQPARAPTAISVHGKPPANPPHSLKPAGSQSKPQDFEFVDCATLSGLTVKTEYEPADSLAPTPVPADSELILGKPTPLLNTDFNLISYNASAAEQIKNLNTSTVCNTLGPFNIKHEILEEDIKVDNIKVEPMDYEDIDPFRDTVQSPIETSQWDPPKNAILNSVSLAIPPVSSQSTEWGPAKNSILSPVPLVRPPVFNQSTEWGPAKNSILSPVSLTIPPGFNQSTEWGPAKNSILNPVSEVPSQYPQEQQRAIAEAERHLQQVEWHPDGGYQCHLCPNLLKTKPRLEAHILRAHLPIKNFSCGYCGLEYRALISVKNHIRLFHRHSPLKVVRKIFQTEKRVRCRSKHKNSQHCSGRKCTHTQIPEVPKFQEAELRKMKQAKANELVVKEIGEKNDSSDEEERVWSGKYKITMSGGLNLGPISKIPSEIELLIKNYKQIKDTELKILSVGESSKGFQCYVCNKYSKRRGDLKMHILSSHYKIRRFQCKYCTCKFIKKSDVEEHHKKEHAHRPLVFVRRFQFENSGFKDARVADLTVTEVEKSKKTSETIGTLHGAPKIYPGSQKISTSCINTQETPEKASIVQSETQKNLGSRKNTENSSTLHEKASKVQSGAQKISGSTTTVLSKPRVRTETEKMPEEDAPNNIQDSLSPNSLQEEKLAVREAELQIISVKETPGRGYQCYLCPSFLCRTDSLRNHVLSVHLNICQFTCKHCPGLDFLRRDDLRKHHNRTHWNLPLVYVRRFRVQNFTTWKNKVTSVKVFWNTQGRKPITESSDNVERVNTPRTSSQTLRTENTPTIIRKEAIPPKKPENYQSITKTLKREIIAVRDAEKKIIRITRHPDYGYKCYLCPKYLASRGTLRMHVVASHLQIKQFSCNHCPGLKFLNRDMTKRHHNLAHPHLPFLTTRMFSVGHMDNSRNNVSCIKLNKETHILTSSRTLNRKDKPSSSRQVDLVVESSPEKSHDEELNEITASMLEREILARDNKTPRNLFQAEDDPTGKTLDEVKTSLLEAEIHARDQRRIDEACLKICRTVPHPKLGFRCFLCSRGTCHRNSLKTHVLNHHMSIKPFECKSCQLTFARYDGARNHFLKTHPGSPIDIVSRFKIPNLTGNCGATALTPTNTTSVTNITDNIENGRMEQFEREKRQIMEVDRRMAEISPNFEGYFECYVCNLVSTKKSTIKNHVIQFHLAIKELACARCGMTFRKAGSLRTHYKRSHPEAQVDYVYRFSGKRWRLDPLTSSRGYRRQALSPDPCLPRSGPQHRLHSTKLNRRLAGAHRTFTPLSGSSTSTIRIPARPYQERSPWKIDFLLAQNTS